MGTITSYTKAQIDTLIAGVNGASTPGLVALDSFTGATDDIKLDNALTYAAAQTRIPGIQFAARDHSLSTNGRVPFTGMKLYGPGGTRGQMNLEIASGQPVNHRVLLHPGTGTTSWFNGSGTYYNIHVVGLAFQAASGGQFWHQPTGTIYACTFDNLTMYGFTSVFGNAANSALITACNFRGLWEVLGWSAAVSQFHFGGSDSNLWMDGQLNLQSGGGTGASTPAIWLDALQKTNIGYIYSTSQFGFGGMRVSSTSDVKLYGGTYEGVNAGSPSTVAVMDIQGGVVKIFGADFNFVTTANGVITQSGGILDLYSPTYSRATAALASYPLLYQTGGTAMIVAPDCRTTSEDCVARWSDTTTTTMTRANKTVLL